MDHEEVVAGEVVTVKDMTVTVVVDAGQTEEVGIMTEEELATAVPNKVCKVL